MYLHGRENHNMSRISKANVLHLYCEVLSILKKPSTLS
jgi:hypothetical protein